MSIESSLIRQTKIFGSTRFDEFRLPEKWVAIGFTRHSCDWLIQRDLLRSGRDKTFLFMSDDESDARILDGPAKPSLQVIEENKFFGYLFLLGAKDEFGVYYETLEGIGFVCGSPESLHHLGLESSSGQEMASYFDAELAALERLGENAATYVRLMRSLPLRHGLPPK